MIPKLVLTDIDGVWTDGGMYYSDSGEELKNIAAGKPIDRPATGTTVPLPSTAGSSSMPTESASPVVPNGAMAAQP